MPTPRRRLLMLLSDGAWTLTFLLRDDFTTAASAPLTSPRSAEPGPGTGTKVDTGNNLTISGGNIVSGGGPGTLNDPSLIFGGLPRAAGIAMVAEFTGSGNSPYIGFSAASPLVSTSQLSALYVFPSAAVLRWADGNISLGTLASATSYNLALVLRSVGAFAFIKGGIYTSWTLAWVSNTTSTTPMYPIIASAAISAAWTDSFIRALQLPAPFNSDYGLATQRLAGAQAAGATFVHEANCLIEFTDTTRPSASNLDLRFRRQDATNYWQVTIDSTGAFTLNEVVAGTPTQRATAAAVVSSGHRVVIVADGTTIKGYSNNVLRWTYSSASNFATATAGELTALGTSGVVNDLIAWPRTLSNLAAGYLDLAVG